LGFIFISYQNLGFLAKILLTKFVCESAIFFVEFGFVKVSGLEREEPGCGKIASSWFDPLLGTFVCHPLGQCCPRSNSPQEKMKKPSRADMLCFYDNRMHGESQS